MPFNFNQHFMKNLIILLNLFTFISCTENPEYYSLCDFEIVDKIDVHIQVRTNRDVFVEQSRKDNFKLLNIVVDASRGRKYIEQPYSYCLDQKTRHSEDFEVATAFSIQEWDDPNWMENTLAWLDKSFKDGAI